MSASERRETAKIYPFPQRRAGHAVRVRPDRPGDAPHEVRSPAIVWDGWYHDVAIADDRAGRA